MSECTNRTIALGFEMLAVILWSAAGCGAILGLDDFVDAETTVMGSGGDAPTTSSAGDAPPASSTGAEEIPTVPVLRIPLNDAYLGTMRKSGSRRPVFSWEASAASAGAPIEYELQYGADPDMSDAASIVTEKTQYRPDLDLDGELFRPVGQRYYWRVRACLLGKCSDFSPVRWFNIGRTKCDFNADGYDDVAVSAVGLTVDPGAIYFYYGAAGRQFGQSSNGVVFEPDGVGGFGVSISCAGDVDGDGYADVLVGAPYGGDSKVFLYRGEQGDRFSGRDVTELRAGGHSVAAAGDVNADGFGDIIAGGDGYAAAHLYLGGPPDVFRASFPITLADDGTAGTVDQTLVSSAGDVNGDGFSDVMVAFISAARHVVHVYFGNPGRGFDAVPKVALEAPSDDPIFVSSMASAGDVNGDGIADIVIGSSQLDRAYVYFGSAEGPSSRPDVTLVGEAGTRFGTAAASAGDMNGDGFDDVAVGTGDYLDSLGVVYLYKGASTVRFDDVSVVALYSLSDRQTGFGSVLGSSGDVNGDGYADLMVGAPFADAVYVYLGRPELVTPAEADASVSQPHQASRPFGVAVTRR
ncbi:FG-GAP-like repeat-containing protein [Sorangium cellulosum]|nr:FG-GAP-like repeat-containing protein [Sorangium cellulosum]